MGLRLPMIAACLALAACGEWKNDAGELTARSASPAPGMACDACHAYPLLDKNHDYHLNTAPSNRDLNGRITCLDCHGRSIRGVPVVVIDTLFRDTVTSEGSFTSANPDPLARNSEGHIIRTQELARVDTLHQNHPVAQPGRPAAASGFQEYVTTLAHLNGTVDVAFDPRNSNPANWGGDTAFFNPKLETCSAVECHPAGEKVYRWAADRKGLPELPAADNPSP
jgi:hypothetical protein